VPRLALGDSAKVEIDAFPGRDFSGRVTQIGNSAIRPPTGGGGQSAIDFEVVITIDDPGVELRPDLSATAQIVTERVNDAVSVPIIAVTVRDRSVVDSTRFALPPIAPGDFQDVEGVFVIEGGTVTFRPVRLGITGAEHFEVVSGLEPGLTVVAGPFQVVRLLENGDPVRVGDPEMIEE
jgi:HlyD family secretion protein